MRRLLRVFLWQLAKRSVVEAVIWSGRRAEQAQGRGPWPIVFLGIVFAAGPPAFLVLLAEVRWVLTGRGPGGRYLLYDVGGPPQRLGRLQRRAGRAADRP